MRILLKKIRNRLAKQKLYPYEYKKEPACIPEEAYNISVETALNSRCCSDYDGDPELFHWGMFDASKKLSDDVVQMVARFAKICRFTDSNLKTRIDQNVFTFIADNSLVGSQRKWAMVESGMQQQAIALVCAALGVGMVFRSMGDNGTLSSKNELSLTQIVIDAMKPAYSGSYWTTHPPTGIKPWLQGNLEDLARKGDSPLLQTLAALQVSHHGEHRISDRSISQLLWAGRGRTPHLYKSKPWGMTIPVSRGEQDISSIYLIKNDQCFLYVNQLNKRPTHSIKLISIDARTLKKRLHNFIPPSEQAILLATNEKSGRAYWEIGYQLLNILVQAKALDLCYHSYMLDNVHFKIEDLKNTIVPIAAVSLGIT